MDTSLTLALSNGHKLIDDLKLNEVITLSDELLLLYFDEDDRARILYLKGEALLHAGHYPLAYSCFSAGAKIATKVNDVKLIAEGFVGLSYVYRFLEDYNAAIDYANRVKELLESTEPTVVYIKALLSEGISNSRLGNHTEATLLLNNALRISKILNNDFLVATSIKSLADFYLYSNDYVHAISLYEKASSYMENKNHFVLKTMIILRLSEAFEQNGEIEKALSYSFIGLEVAQQNLFMAGEKFAHQLLSRLFERKLDTEKAFKHLKAYLDLHNRINASKQMNNINKMELDFVKEAKDKEIYLLEQIKEKHKAISESISYAQRLQEAILPINKSLEDSSINYFVFFKPKEKVGGDFYWIDSSENSSIFCLADCTGHGIPGAMLSMLCSNLVRNALKNNKKPHLNNIISMVNNMLHDTLGLSEINNVNDGMDISFCSISKKPKSDYWELKFAGANHVGIIISEDKALQVAYNRIGISIQTDRDYKFDETIYRLHKGDSFYMFSDGYADQFGGLTEEERKQGGKKFKYKRLTELFSKIHKEELIEQRQILENMLNDWMGDLEQIDDVTVIGFRV